MCVRGIQVGHTTTNQDTPGHPAAWCIPRACAHAVVLVRHTYPSQPISDMSGGDEAPHTRAKRTGHIGQIGHPDSDMSDMLGHIGQGHTGAN